MLVDICWLCTHCWFA